MNTDHEIAVVRRRPGNEVNRAGKGVFDPAAKHEAAALARTRQADGHSVASTARLLGIHPVVLARWMRGAHNPSSDRLLDGSVRHRESARRARLR